MFDSGNGGRDDEDQRPGIEERYLSATNTSSLKVDPDRSTQADVILAAGMVQNRLGHALIHLRAAWDKADKPCKKTPAEIAKRAAQIPDKKGRPDVRRAEIEALVWHASEMRALAQRLPGRNAALGWLTEWADLYGVDRDLLSPALFHWLAPKCPACDGHGTMKIPGSPGLSKQGCRHCHGVGTWPRPLGADRVHTHIASCIGKARGDMARRLYG
jgi:hypothetical protein